MKRMLAMFGLTLLISCGYATPEEMNEQPAGEEVESVDQSLCYGGCAGSRLPYYACNGRVVAWRTPCTGNFYCHAGSCRRF